MSRPRHKPRRRYVPKRIDADPIGLAIGGACLLSPAQREPMRIAMQQAFDLFRRGHGTHDAWCSLADAVNVAEVLAELRIANDHAEKFTDAQAALAAVQQRKEAGGSYTLRPAEITTLQDALEIHEIQLEHATQTECSTAIELVKRRMRGALAGSPPRGAIVLAPANTGWRKARDETGQGGSHA